MADKLAYIKFFFENRIAIIGIIISLGGYNGFQFLEGKEKTSDISLLKTQITEMAGMISKSDKPIINNKPDNWGRYVNALEGKIKAHNRNYHGD